MTEHEFFLHDGQSGAAITVRITPRASRDEISEILEDGTIKVRLTAAPNEAKTNLALVQFLAQVLEVNPKQIEIVAGLSGNDKLITITNLDKRLVQERILKNLS